MPRIDTKYTGNLLQIKRKFYSIKEMKNFFKLIILILTLALFSKSAFSCDAIKNVLVGENFSKSSETLDFIGDYNEEDYDESITVEYQTETREYCPDAGLDNTILKAYIYQSKIAGIKLETWDPEIEKNKIYEFVKNNYGNIDEEPKNENWTGYRDVSSGNTKILYAKIEGISGIIETLDITTEELMDHTVGANVVQSGY